MKRLIRLSLLAAVLGFLGIGVGGSMLHFLYSAWRHAGI